MANSEGSGRFRVVIVGAGVAGLTLANALEQANVDYVLLERRSEVAPQIGASIGMFPNGARILDQLGVWGAVEKGAVRRDTAWLGVSGRTCYASCTRTSRIPAKFSSTKVSPTLSTMTTASPPFARMEPPFRTRTKLWQFAEADHPKLVKEDKDCMISEYNCLFGIVNNLDCPRFPEGDVHTTYNERRCALSISVEGGKAYYFAQERLPRTHRLGDIPRYTDADAKDFVERHRDFILLPGNGGFTLQDLWEKTVTARLVAVEEAKFKLWHWGRITCVGDSIHKATPNLGVGGNSAIESAAALANGIKLLADKWNATDRRPTRQDIEAMLTTYQKGRELRAGAVVDASGFLARTQNMDGLTSYFVKFLLPHLSEFVPELMGNAIIGATKIDYLPLPMVSLTGAKPFNPSQGDGHRESKFKRMVYALPLLALFFVAGWVMNATPALDWATGLLDSGVIRLASGDVPILRSFYQFPAFDDFVAVYNTFFFPTVYDADPVARRQLISFLTDGTILLTIWIFESARRANIMTPLQFPTIYIALGQLVGIGLAAPLYTFIHYVLSPIENFSALDQRLTRTRTTYAALPAVLLTYLLPFVLTLTWPDLPTRQALLYAWQLYPAWLSLAVWGIGRLLFKDEMETDKVYRTQRDLGVMRWYLGVLGVLAAGVWWWSWWGVGLAEVFVPVGLPRSMGDFYGFAGQLLRWDEMFGLGSLLVWLAYLFWDLRAAGMLREGWLRVVGMGLVSVLVVGPGATIGMGWLFREHILATRRHKDALTPESVGRLHGVFVMAGQDHDTLVHFAVGPFSMSYTIPASKFRLLYWTPRFLFPDHNGPVECPELHGHVWRMFLSWLCTHCDLHSPQFWRCLACFKIDLPGSCHGCKTHNRRARTLPPQAKKVEKFHVERGGLPIFEELPPQPALPTEPVPLEILEPLCHARRLDLQFQLYYFAVKQNLIELQRLVLFKVWYTFMQLQPHPGTNAAMLESILVPISRLPPGDVLRTLVTSYWACVREEMARTPRCRAGLAQRSPKRCVDWWAVFVHIEAARADSDLATPCV
ncbi:uncharacterized protein B0H64DRAFT_418187 [Chaetomium fimeti]|uniref:FAD-binding domain-containing protein n=1 Tax=Chaetomium fimeti TaxID=1854472 RepID=A0AAE0HD89_9PEZI|nr:hypothetical protein B0H64DRAFT_418187 [Chaetomium fimeti]